MSSRNLNCKSKRWKRYDGQWRQLLVVVSRCSTHPSQACTLCRRRSTNSTSKLARITSTPTRATSTTAWYSLTFGGFIPTRYFLSLTYICSRTRLDPACQGLPVPLFWRAYPGLSSQPLCAHWHNQPRHENSGLLSGQGLPIQAPQAGLLRLSNQLGQVCGLRGQALHRVAKLLVRSVHQNAGGARGTNEYSYRRCTYPLIRTLVLGRIPNTSSIIRKSRLAPAPAAPGERGMKKGTTSISHHGSNLAQCIM